MGTLTKIQWTDHTFNPWIGCTKVSPGCVNCYAESSTPARVFGVRWGVDLPRHRTSESNWEKVATWNRKAYRDGVRHKVFVASLADVFDTKVPHEWREDLWALIYQCPYLDFQILTKRLNVLCIQELLAMVPTRWLTYWPDHVWFGHSICTQKEADNVIPLIAQIPAKTRFISLEPILEPIVLPDSAKCLAWAIIGGESGPKARVFDPEWCQNLLADCERLSIAPFVKQLGANVVGLSLTDSKGGSIAEWPEDIATRRFPDEL